jgi:YVTN family beta-propeller protein
MKSNKLLTLLVLSMIIFSCTDDEDPVEKTKGDYEFGYFITNEGPFQNGSGTLTFVGDDGNVQQEVYKTVNGENLGNIVNSMFIDGDRAYIVVNNSSRVVVVNRNTMEKIAVIEGNGVEQPRHFVAIDGTGYLSNWGDPFDPTDDFITVIDLATYEVQGTISVGEGPERMLATSTGLFVTLQGGFGQNNEVVVIDPASNQIARNIEVGDVPNSLQDDGLGHVWVLCGGNPSFTGSETSGKLYKILLSDLSTTYQEFGPTDHPGLLNFDSGQLYYLLNGQVFRMNPGVAELPEDGIAGLEGFYYSMTVENGELYGADAGDFASEGIVKVFNVNSGALLNTIEAGIVPGQVVFP